MAMLGNKGSVTRPPSAGTALARPGVTTSDTPSGAMPLSPAALQAYRQKQGIGMPEPPYQNEARSQQLGQVMALRQREPVSPVTKALVERAMPLPLPVSKLPEAQRAWGPTPGMTGRPSAPPSWLMPGATPQPAWATNQPAPLPAWATARPAPGVSIGWNGQPETMTPQMLALARLRAGSG